MTLLNPMQAFADQLPTGWDKATDLLVATGGYSDRVALLSIVGAVSKYILLPSNSIQVKMYPELMISGTGVGYHHLLPPAPRKESNGRQA